MPYDHLLKMEKKGKQSYWPAGAEDEYDVRQLLGMVDKDQHRQNLVELRKEYGQLKKGQDANRRGLELEGFLYRLFQHFDMKPGKSFRNPGEQIDGSFQVGHEVYLLEAKWHKKKTGNEPLGAFESKIRGKPQGTWGLFVSINGFTKVGLKAFCAKPTCILCMDGNDLELILADKITLPEAIDLKKRRASENNQAFVPLSKLMGP